MSPDQGSVLGGEKVTITGTNLNGASAVMFGEVPASSFTVVNEEKITAMAPAQAKAGTVDIVATTLAGESPTGRADQFLYRGCTVPKLAGKSLGSAKAALRNAGCKVGKVSKVKGPKKKHGKVVHQSPNGGPGARAGRDGRDQARQADRRPSPKRADRPVGGRRQRQRRRSRRCAPC